MQKSCLTFEREYVPQQKKKKKKKIVTNECLAKVDKVKLSGVRLQQSVHLERVLPETTVERVKCATKIHL